MRLLTLLLIFVCLSVSVLTNVVKNKEKIPERPKNIPEGIWEKIWKKVVKEYPNYLEKNPEEHIFGGEDVDIQDFPYTVSLRYNGGHYCGGALICDQWVLTSGRCADPKLNMITLLMGATNSSDDGNGGGVIRKAAKKVRHYRYKEYNADFDIAAIQLDSPVRFGDRIQPIALPGCNVTIPKGTNSTISGWGFNAPWQPFPDILQALNERTISNSRCEEAYGSRLIRDSMFCAGNLKIEDHHVLEGACYGDNGGPLVANIKTKDYLIGLASWGLGCADQKFPFIYTRIPYVREWIYNTTGV